MRVVSVGIMKEGVWYGGGRGEGILRQDVDLDSVNGNDVAGGEGGDTEGTFAGYAGYTSEELEEMKRENLEMERMLDATGFFTKEPQPQPGDHGFRVHVVKSIARFIVTAIYRRIGFRMRIVDDRCHHRSVRLYFSGLWEHLPTPSEAPFLWTRHCWVIGKRHIWYLPLEFN